MPSIPAINASFSLLDTNKAQFWYQALSGTSGNSSSYLDFLTPGDTTNARLGSAAGNCIRMRNPYDSMQGVFYIPSTGYHNIIVKFATERSGSGPTRQNYSYSLDSGTTWETSGINVSTDSINATASPFQLETIGFSPVADNNPKLVFRIQMVNALAGNNRYDNFTVESSPTVNAVAQIATPALNCSLFPNPATNEVNLSIPVSGEKTITIYNTTGQKVSAVTTTATELTINTNLFSTGLYFVNIQAGNQHNSMKFIKN